MPDQVQTVTLGQQLASYGAATWAWVIGLSMLGGIANFAIKVRAKATRLLNIPELLGECVISGFVGVLTFLITDGHAPPAVQAALIAIASHMGTRAIFMFEQILSVRLTGKPMPAQSDDADKTDVPK